MGLRAQGIPLVLIYLQTQTQSRKGDWEPLGDAETNPVEQQGWQWLGAGTAGGSRHGKAGFWLCTWKGWTFSPPGVVPEVRPLSSPWCRVWSSLCKLSTPWER